MIESNLRVQVRLAGHADLQTCVDLLPTWLVLPPAVRAALPVIWTRLLYQPCFNADLMEDLNRPPGARALALGMSIALDENWQQRLQQDPPTCVAAALYQGLLDGSFTPLSDAELGKLNAQGKVAFMVLHYSQRFTDYGEADAQNLLQVAMNTFRHVHSGFRLRQLFQEGVGEELGYMTSMGFQRCQPQQPELPGQPVLCGLSYEDALRQMPGTPVRDAFQFTPPLIGFSPSERRLLRLAVTDLSDERIGDELGLSNHTIKKLWRSIHQRAAERMPTLFADDASASAAELSSRGPEKRRLLIPYLRQHPEELRPYASL